MNQQDTGHLFETGLDRTPANFVPLSPVSFLRRSAASFRDKVAVIDGERHFTYGSCMSVARGSHPRWQRAAWSTWTRWRSWPRTFPR